MIKIKEGRGNEEQLDGRDENQWSQKGGREEGGEQREGRQIQTEDKGGRKEG